MNSINMMNLLHLLAGSSKLDLKIESGREILFSMAEVASLTNIIVITNYFSVQITLDEKCERRIEKMNSNLSINVDKRQSVDEIDEGQYFYIGKNGSPFEHMNFPANVIVILSKVVQD